MKNLGILANVQEAKEHTKRRAGYEVKTYSIDMIPRPSRGQSNEVALLEMAGQDGVNLTAVKRRRNKLLKAQGDVVFYRIEGEFRKLHMDALVRNA